MATLRPFQALRPVPERAAQVAAVPYDVVSGEEAAALARGNPWSFLRVSRAEIDLPEGTAPYSAQVYARAKANLDRLTREAPLVRESEPSLYIYRLEKDGRSQTGVAGTWSVDEYESGAILRHERTRQDKEDDRTRHLLALGAQTGPVFLAYRDRPDVAGAIARSIEGRSPLFSFTAPDGVAHTVWRAPDASTLVAGFAEVPKLYIADGHHRAASAARARRESPAASAAYFLAVAFPASELRILPYHRVLRDLNGLAPAAALEAISKAMRVRPDTDPEPAKGRFSLYLAGRWHGLEPREAPAGSAIERLDVSILQDRVLGPIFGIRDPRTDPRIDFVGGARGTPELEERVRSGRAACAFSLHATSMEELMQVSDAGGIMPPKSTWFEPKLRDGLLSHALD